VWSGFSSISIFHWIYMLVQFLTFRQYLFDVKQLMVSWTQDNWNIISSLLQSTFQHIIDISITTCAHFKLQLCSDPMPVAAGSHASPLCRSCCHSAAQQRRRLYNASPAAAAQCSSGGRRRAAQQWRPPRSGAACQHSAQVGGPTTWRLKKKMHGHGWPRGGAGRDGGALAGGWGSVVE
jgi:hypothetical protein